MKAFNEVKIRRSEVLQLILLHLIYAQQSSREVFFQGGTAIRWCYGGTRFSEDLDFVTPLEIGQLQKLILAVTKSLEREAVAHFGPGAVTVSQKPSRDNALKVLFTYAPVSGRDRTAVKVEFERLAAGRVPGTGRMVIGSMPSAARLIAEGEFKVPRSSSVVLVETPTEIVSDKIRALLERPYLKGRDLYDLWFLSSVKGEKAAPETVLAKLGMYNAEFTAA
ncbi:MAG: nucleotidyl transferase AbiEii/AbiGii toxin family protein, partial [Myxococcota bacterium]